MNVNDINHIIEDYIKIMTKNNNIDSIVLSGSKTSLINDDMSDYDIYVYCKASAKSREDMDSRKEFADNIKQLLHERQVIAKYKGKNLTSRNAISANLKFLDEWEFIDYQGRVASKKSAVNAIKEIRSYRLENKFNTYMEKRTQISAE